MSINLSGLESASASSAALGTSASGDTANLSASGDTTSVTTSADGSTVTTVQDKKGEIVSITTTPPTRPPEPDNASASGGISVTA
jgi:hypothetical protein